MKKRCIEGWGIMLAVVLLSSILLIACTDKQNPEDTITGESNYAEEVSTAPYDATESEELTESEDITQFETETQSDEATEPGDITEYETETQFNDKPKEEEPDMWDEKKDIVKHLSFDQLWEGLGDSGNNVFTPGQSSAWNGIADFSFSTAQGVTFWGWIAVKGEFGVFGYR